PRDDRGDCPWRLPGHQQRRMDRARDRHRPCVDHGSVEHLHRNALRSLVQGRVSSAGKDHQGCRRRRRSDLGALRRCYRNRHFPILSRVDRTGGWFRLLHRQVGRWPDRPPRRTDQCPGLEISQTSLRSVRLISSIRRSEYSEVDAPFMLQYGQHTKKTQFHMRAIMRQYRPLILGLALLFTLLATRMIWHGSFRFAFLVWNVFLAILPLAFARAAVHTRRPFRRWAYAALWLLFFPNSAYLLTDIVHLRHGQG